MLPQNLPRILIVDDEKENLDALRRLLRKDFEVLSALSGEEGLTILESPQAGSLNAVVSDQRMPGMQGSEFLERASQLQPLLTRILLTGFSDIEAVVEAVNRGQIWRYIAKPWEPADFIAVMRQAVERTQLQKSLSESRLELQRALNELRAKDWARERLLQILLHEFRTAPQIIDGLKNLDPGGPDADSRLRFMESLENRFKTMSTDISELLAEEKKIAQLPKHKVNLQDVATSFAQSQKASLDCHGPSSAAPLILAEENVLQSALAHFLNILKLNTQRAAVTLSLDWDTKPGSDVFLAFTIKSLDASKKLLPIGLEKVESDPAIAWPLLLEPFVGHEDFSHHSQGLRVETARFVRHLVALGGKLAFQISPKKDQVELLLAFKTTS